MEAYRGEERDQEERESLRCEDLLILLRESSEISARRRSVRQSSPTGVSVRTKIRNLNNRLKNDMFASR